MSKNPDSGLNERPHELNCPAIYGPVKSRRHGYSLGINLGSDEEKTCTWGCVYCQCGMGRRGEPDPAHSSVPRKSKLLPEIETAIRDAGDRLDSVTFAGNSEPGVHPEFLEIVGALRQLKVTRHARWTLNCLSNGSELDRDEVVAACNDLDEAWIKLDCGDGDLFRRLNHPLARIGTVSDQIRRIRRLREPRIQTLLWKNPGDTRLENWTSGNRASLLEAYSEIRPTEIHLTTVERKTPVPGLGPVPAPELEMFRDEIKVLGLKVQVFPARG